MANEKLAVRNSSSGRRRESSTNSRSGRRRQELVDTAASIFTEKGFHATSVQDVAEALGILKGSIYYYIDSKEDLLWEVVEPRLTFIDDLLARLRSTKLDTQSRLRAYVEETTKQVLTDPVRSAVFVREVWSLTGDRLATAEDLLGRQDKFLRRQITAGQRAGVVCPDVDASVVSRGITGMVVWVWTINWRAKAGKAKAESVAAAYADMVMASVSCDRKTHKPGHRSEVGELPDSWE